MYEFSLFFFFLVLLFSFFRFENYKFALAVPWLLVLTFNFIPVSNFHESVTSLAILYLVLFSGFFVFFGFLGGKLASNSKNNLAVHYKPGYFLFFLMLFFLLTFANIFFAGYIPLLESLAGRPSNYLSFGISGLYGFYNAFANSLALLCFYFYLVDRKRLFLFAYFFILCFFVLFLSRQNIISVVIESFIVYAFYVRRISLYKIFAGVLVFFAVFDILGNVRGSNIAVDLEVADDYLMLPNSILWLYSYFYLSFLNFSNSIIFAPYYDMSSLMSLVPNVIKGYFGVVGHNDYFLQKINFNVSTALQPIRADLGVFGIALYGAFFGFFTGLLLTKAKSKSFFSVLTYSVLYFCCLFSFFINFWFYLPVVFQIVFFKIYEVIFSSKKRLR